MLVLGIRVFCEPRKIILNLCRHSQSVYQFNSRSTQRFPFSKIIENYGDVLIKGNLNGTQV